MTWEAHENGAHNSTLDALESFIASQRALLTRQRADIDRLQHLKNDLSLRPGYLLDHLSEELADPAFRLSEQADLKLKLPPKLDWKAFERSDPTSLHALNIAIPTRTPLATQTAPLSELQSFVKNAARTLLEPRMRKYPRVSTPPPDSDCENDAHDPIAARRAREQAKIRELKAMVRRGGGYGGGLRTMGLIRTDVGEEAMRAEVQIDDDDGDEGFSKGKRPGKGRVPSNSVNGKRPGKHYGKSVPAAYLLQADEGDNDGAAPGASPAPSYATKNIGLVAEHAHSAAASPEPDVDVPFDQDRDADMDLSMAVDAPAPDPSNAELLPLSDLEEPPLPLPSPAGTAIPPKPKPKPKTKPKPKAKPKPKPKPKRVVKASYEYTDEESDLGVDVDLGHEDDSETYEGAYQDPAAFVPSVTVHPSSSSDEDEDVDMLEMDLDVAPRKSSTKNRNSKAGAKARTKAKPKSKPPPKKKKKNSVDFTSSSDGDHSDGTTAAPTPTTPTAKNARKPPKPKPETYKQAWSTDEQNLLEQLLEEIPDGERFRWQKISRAMGGRRTPRQVASRVQKYFEKLKKYDLM
ncbi:hypothetical protein D9619_010008 [Psilocybe cf. subviscida]|uniref:Myb-like domain-containing protein n=1 Tax=Psilocybe cf. subviscida TaxID=2480587 RepID=A0A8H5BL69_9AGAR|nr:hypothetical protein D9619_010008 [Psilocybe cf. subviscida]